jgi:hypothetical protein
MTKISTTTGPTEAERQMLRDAKDLEERARSAPEREWRDLAARALALRQAAARIAQRRRDLEGDELPLGPPQ